MLHKLPSWNNFKEIAIYKQNLTLFWPPTAPAHLLHSLWRGSLGSCTCVCAQLHLTLCNPMNCSPAGSSVHRISQARTLEWLLFTSPGDLPDPGIEPMSFVSPALAGRFFKTYNLRFWYQEIIETIHKWDFIQDSLMGQEIDKKR